MGGMTARTHDLAAATALAVLLLVDTPEPLRLSTLLIAILANQLGGIAPDTDQPTAPFWRNLPEGHFVGKAFGKLLGGHRFLSHSLLGFALFGFLAKLLLEFLHPILPHVDTHFVWDAFMVGYGSHLVMDSFTKEGVPWLLPIPFKFGLPPLRALRITTGKAGETLLVLPLLIGVNIWLAMAYYGEFTALLRHVMR
jgi:inner membrane protein